MSELVPNLTECVAALTHHSDAVTLAAAFDTLDLAAAPPRPSGQATPRSSCCIAGPASARF